MERDNEISPNEPPVEEEHKEENKIEAAEEHNEQNVCKRDSAHLIRRIRKELQVEQHSLFFENVKQ